jgi:homoserine dehydrogenase
LQPEPAAGETSTDVVLLTHRALERDVDEAIAAIQTLPTVLGPVVRLRMEDLS